MKDTLFVAFDPLSQTKEQLIDSAIELARPRQLPIYLYGVRGATVLKPEYQQPYSVAMVQEAQPGAQEINDIMVKLSHRYRGKCKRIEVNFTYGFEGEAVIRKVKEISDEIHPYLVLLEKKAEESLLSEWFGTAETIVAQHVDCPTLILPEGYRLKDINRITYALDSSIQHIPHINFLKQLAKDFYAKIEIISTAESTDELKHLEVLKQEYAADSDIAIFHLKNAADFTDIQKRAKQPGITIFAFPDRQKSFFERLFNNDNTRHLIVSTDTPVLVF